MALHSPPRRPRFSRTPSRIRSAPSAPGAHTLEGLQDWGFSPSEIERLRDAEAIA